jgi:hypothetical protein
MNKGCHVIQKNKHNIHKLETLVIHLKYKKDEKNCDLRKRRNW